MTGRGVLVTREGTIFRAKQTPRDCANWLREFTDKVEVVELDKADVLDALDNAQSLDVQVGHVYDYLHALASRKAKADELLTRNTDDFKELAHNPVWP